MPLFALEILSTSEDFCPSDEGLHYSRGTDLCKVGPDCVVPPPVPLTSWIVHPHPQNVRSVSVSKRRQ